MSYNNRHRNLLRLVASRGVISLLKTKDYIKDLKIDQIKNLVPTINEKIKGLKQEIKIVQDENTSTHDEYLVFISVGYDDISKLQTYYSKTQLNFFKTLIEKIMVKETRTISYDELIQKNKPYTLDKPLLATLCRMSYLRQIRDDEYGLGLRLIHEFENYFDQYMPGVIKECWKCHKKVYDQEVCPKCNEVFHIRCRSNFSRNNNKWPCCDYTENRARNDSSTDITVLSSGDDDDDSEPPAPKKASSSTDITVLSSGDDDDDSEPPAPKKARSSRS